MELDDPGFDASVLSEFRARLVEHELEGEGARPSADRAQGPGWWTRSDAPRLFGSFSSASCHVLGRIPAQRVPPAQIRAQPPVDVRAR
jgi:hypothetical protein